MSNLTDFFPSGGGGGLTPKFEEFNASGTFTPTQALIDAGGYIEVFLVGGGGTTNSGSDGACGGEVLIKKMYLTSVSGVAVTIGAGATSTLGGDTSFAGSSAGGYNLTSLGGYSNGNQQYRLGAGWGGEDSSNSMTAGNGVLGYGAGAGGGYRGGGVYTPKPNSGQGSFASQMGGSGYCLIKWYE